ncbi:MAG: hypothetical protein R2712_06640 [Vicinamibacterales bacterium]
MLDTAFPTFPDGFPPGMIEAFERRIGRRVLGNVVASGTAIIDEPARRAWRPASPSSTRRPTASLQIAAHRPSCRRNIFLRLVPRRLRAGGRGRRARPRHRAAVRWHARCVRSHGQPARYAMPPIRNTLLDHLQPAAGHPVVAIRKVSDLFAGRGVTESHATRSDDRSMDVLVGCLDYTHADGLLFVNLVDFDTRFGHRNDVPGYARNLEAFDAGLADLLPRLVGRPRS